METSQKQRGVRLAILFFLLCPGETIADVTVEGTSHCIDRLALKTQIEKVIREQSPDSGPSLTVDIELADLEISSTHLSSTHLKLSIHFPDSSLALTREYTLPIQDCPNAGDLLAEVISDFLEELPATNWEVVKPKPKPPAIKTNTAKPKQSPPPIAKHQTVYYGLGAQVMSALDSAGGSIQTDQEVQLHAELGLLRSNNTLFIGLDARTSTAQDLVSGQFRSNFLLAHVGLSRGQHWVWSVNLSGGSLRVSGSGFDDNFALWLPWLEAGAQIGYQVGQLNFFGGLRASPLRHNVRIENREESAIIPRLRVGIGASIHWYSKIL